MLFMQTSLAHLWLLLELKERNMHLYGSDHVLLKKTAKEGHVDHDLKCLFYTQFEYEKKN